MQTGTATDGLGYTDTLVSIEYVVATPFADTVVLNDAALGCEGGAGNDTLVGGAGNNVFVPGAGNDSVDGGVGADLVLLVGTRSKYVMTKTASGWTLDGTAAGEGTDTLTNVERFSFADKNTAFDLDGHAGEVAKLLGAVFGSGFVQDKVYVGTGLTYADSGLSEEALASLALEVKLGAAPTAAQVVNLLYTNVIGTAPDADTAHYFESLLTGGQYTAASLAVMAAETDYNAQHIGFAGLVQTGIDYV